MKKQLSLLILFFAFFSSSSWAQNNKLENYVPPPLFGAPKQAPSDEEQPKKDLKPLSPSTKNVAPKMSEQPASHFIAPKPKTKPPALEKKLEVLPGPEPIDLLKVKKDKPASEGVVKGPKIMPSNKKQKVDTEITFESKEDNSSNLLDRIQKEEEQTPAKKEEKAVDLNVPVPDFETLPDGAKKMVLLFKEKQENLAQEQKTIIERAIVQALKENEDLKLLIQAYASLQEGVLNADRRIALSRAMAIRGYLLEQEISAHRINVRALGARSSIQPLDRVELILNK